MNSANSKLQTLLELQKSFTGTVLTFAEAALPEGQFKAFKKLVMQEYHEKLKPQVRKIIIEKDQPRAVPQQGNFEGTGGGYG